MSLDFLYDANEWLVVLIYFVLLLLAGEGGFRLGCRRQPDPEDTTRSQTSSIQGAVLALFGLLLAFTVSMAVSRYDLRKQLVVEESTALGTTYLRAQLLPEPYRAEVSTLLRRYVDIRLEFFAVGADQMRVAQISNETEQIQDELWAQAIAVGTSDPHAITTGLFLTSLNETIDIPTQRLAALQNRIPDVVIFLLFFSGIVAVGVVGYGYGPGGSRNILLMALFSVPIALVILVIIDLDRPRRGLITVSQQSMLDLRESMNRTRFWDEQGFWNPCRVSWLYIYAREASSLTELMSPGLDHEQQSAVATLHRKRPYGSTAPARGNSLVHLQGATGAGFARAGGIGR